LSKKLMIGIALAAPLALAPVAHAKDVTVMTRNLYLGADLIPLAAAPADQFQHAASGVFDGVASTNPDARMKLVGKEIATAKPDLVGLQEVSLWRTGSNPASTVRYDYTGAILKELRRRHAPYRLVVLKRGFNVEAPTDRGFDVRLTLGDAILARKGVKVSHARSGVFAHQLTIPTNGIGPVKVTRGWTALDARLGKARLHFVNTHLEAYATDVREQQAKELVAGPLKSKLETVLVGDLNSGPDLAQPGDRLAYAAIAAAGFKPERTAKPSCCFNDDLKSGAWDHNVDWIMAEPKVKLVRSSLTGTAKTATGRRAADHGGVVSTLRLG
jgi:endonuclease/exonuclease/phosphatase family metal-dependent hydrolase